jgi:hypothetical protein
MYFTLLYIMCNMREEKQKETVEICFPPKNKRNDTNSMHNPSSPER